jgi:sacsin
LPFVPGNECSGVVIEVGRDVLSLKIGDRVCAVVQNGAFAEEVVAQALATVKLPASCDVEAAAGLPVAFGTAWMALKDRANVQPGQTVLILGAAGGVGFAAVQLSKALGAVVVAVAQGSAKMEALRAAGADECIDMQGRKPEDLRMLIKRAVPHGVDVLFDPVGGALFSEAFKTIKWGGHIVVVGFASGKVPSLPGNLLLVKNLTVSGLYWGKTLTMNPAAFRRSLEEIARLYANSDIAVHVSHTYSLEQAAEAFGVLMNRRVIGKLLLCPTPRSML